VEFARAREAAGLTQEAFAGLTGVEVSTVVRWESGGTTPLPGKRPQIARVLGVGLPELEKLLSPVGAHPLPGIGPAQAGVVAARSESDNGRLAAIAAVREEIADLTAEYEAWPATGLVVRAAELLGRIEALRISALVRASGSSQPPGPYRFGPGPVTAPTARIRWRRELDSAEAEAALLLGRLLWNAAGRRDSSAAEEFFDRAARRAAQAGDSVLQVCAALRAAFVGLYGGDPRAGVRHCVQAAAIAAPVSEALFALARLHAAEGHALLGQAAECDHALATARGAMAAIDADDPAPGACPPRTYQRLSGAAHLALGRHAEARAALTEAAARHEPGKALALVLGQLALACLGEGDTDAALRHLRPAIELADATRSPAALAVASRAGRELMQVSGAAHTEALEIVDRLLAIPAGC
jgi:transcriptional regulator with XRE-family HTH domain